MPVQHSILRFRLSLWIMNNNQKSAAADSWMICSSAFWYTAVSRNPNRYVVVSYLLLEQQKQLLVMPALHT